MSDNKNIVSAPRHLLKTLYKKDLSDLDISQLSQTEIVDIRKHILNQFVGAYPYIIQWGLYLYTHSKELLKETENDFYIELPKNDLLNSMLSFKINRWQKEFVWREILNLNQLSSKGNNVELFRFFINKDNQVVRDIPLRVALNFGDVQKVLNYKNTKTKNGNSIKHVINRIETITVHFNKQFFSENVTGSFFKIPREYFATSKSILEIFKTFNETENKLELENTKLNIKNINASKLSNLICYFNDVWTGNRENNNDIRMFSTDKDGYEINRYLDIANNIFREHYRDGKIVNKKSLIKDIQNSIEIYKKCVSISIAEFIEDETMLQNKTISSKIDMLPESLEDDTICMSDENKILSETIKDISFFSILLYKYFIQKNICNADLIPTSYNQKPLPPKMIKLLDKLLKSHTKKKLTNLANSLIESTNIHTRSTGQAQHLASIQAYNTTLQILRNPKA